MTAYRAQMGFSAHLLRGHAVTDQGRWIGLLFVDRRPAKGLFIWSTYFWHTSL